MEVIPSVYAATIAQRGTETRQNTMQKCTKMAETTGAVEISAMRPGSDLRADPVGQLVAHDPDPHAEKECHQQSGASDAVGPHRQHARKGERFEQREREDGMKEHRRGLYTRLTKELDFCIRSMQSKYRFPMKSMTWQCICVGPGTCE